MNNHLIKPREAQFCAATRVIMGLLYPIGRQFQEGLAIDLERAIRTSCHPRKIRRPSPRGMWSATFVTL